MVWLRLRSKGSADEHGDYSAVLCEFRPLAEQGDIEARYNLGGKYYKDEDVAQDFAEVQPDGEFDQQVGFERWLKAT